MSSNLQKLMKEALLNNTYDYNVMHDTIKMAWMNSYSYLYYLQKANIEYEELFFYSGDEVSRDTRKIGKLYLDNLLRPNFDVDYDLIGAYSREQYRTSRFYQKQFTFEDIVYNPDIFVKMPIVIIDDKLCWDYKVTVKKDSTSFLLPFKKTFAIKDARNTITDDIVYIDHKIQVLIVENIFYQRYEYSKQNLHFDASKKLFKLRKSDLISQSESQINTSVTTDYMERYNVKYAFNLSEAQKVAISKEVKRRQKCVELPKQDGVMFASLHFMNDNRKTYELGTTFIEMYEDDTYFTGYLTDDQVEMIQNQTNNMFVSLFFVRRLYKHTFYDGESINTVDSDGAKLMVMEREPNVPFDAPIPVENFMIMKKPHDSQGWHLEKNTDMLEMFYPNIYRIKDETKQTGDSYTLYYFYYPTPDLKYTVMFDFYFKFLRDIFSVDSMEKVFNDIYYGHADLSMYTEYQKAQFEQIFMKILSYSAFHYQYGDTDFLIRYLKTEGNYDKAPIEYKDETLKSWIREDPWLLRDYVLDQKKLGDSYHLFTNTIDLQSRLRFSTEIELGEKSIYSFDEPRYVFAFANEREYPVLLDCRIFVDGLLVGDVYQRRKLFIDYFYIPVWAVTEDSYIELEIFPRYQFDKEIEFTSMDDSVEITIAEPEENIYPTTADLIVQKESPITNGRYITPEFVRDSKLLPDNTAEVKENYFVGEILVQDDDVAVEATFWVNYDTDSYAVYLFLDENNNVVGYKTNLVYDAHTKAAPFRCYSVLPDNTKKVKVCIYKSPDEEINLREIKILMMSSFSVGTVPTRYSTNMFDITCHYDRGNFEFSSDDPSKPVKFTRLSTFDLKPTSESLLNVPLHVKFSKIPIMVRFRIDVAGYAFIELGTDDFKFNTDYIRVFRNGRLIPKVRYRLLTGYARPRMLFVEWFDINDIVYIDITPYRYTQIYHKENLTKDETLIDLRGIINKPFDIRYYDVYMNGRKLSLNNVFSITPWEITLVNLKSNYNLDIYERERDWEYFGLDYYEDIYYFSFDDLIHSGIVSEDEFCKLIKDRIDELKDERLNIYPNTNDEEPLDYSDTDMIYPVFFIFYYDELIPKTFVNPDICQFSQEIMENNFPEVLTKYKVFSYQYAKNQIERMRKLNYPPVLCLDPDIMIESTNKGQKGIIDVRMNDKKNDYYYDENGMLIFAPEPLEGRDRSKITDDEFIANMDENSSVDDMDVILSEGVVIVYEVGHVGDVEQELLDQHIEIDTNN